MTLSDFDAHLIGHGNGREEPLKITHTIPKEHFLIPSHYESEVASVLIPNGLLRDRIERLAADIRKFYSPNDTIHLICLLKGSRGFFAELVAVLNRIYRYTDGQAVAPFKEYYVRLKKDPNHPGHIHAVSDDLTELRGGNVLIVEDLVDTGATLSKFCRQVLDIKPKSLRVASLLEKRNEKGEVAFKADFVGFSIPNLFVVGYCMDLQERFRDLEHMVLLNDEAFDKYKKV